MKKITLLIIRIGKKLFYNTPIHRSKAVNFVYRKLFLAAFAKEEVITVNYEGAEFKFLTNDVTILPSILNDDYEKTEIRLMRQLLKPGMVLVDVGANVGLFSVIGAKIVGKKGKVYAFEPEPRNFELLKENISLNKIDNTICENLAVGDKKTKLKLQIVNNSAGTHSFIKKEVNMSDEEIEVQVVSMDEYFANNLKKINVMKIDVEGYEPLVLKGAKKLLENVDYVLFEYNRADVKRIFGIENMVKLLKSFPGLYAIDEKSGALESYDISDLHKTKYINLVASKKQILKMKIG